MSETVDNKKFTMTNRVALSIVVGIIAATFGATKFYDETKFQALVSQTNKERIELVNNNLSSKIDDNYKTLWSKIEEVWAAAKAYVEQEVGGLRSDWERRNKEIDQRFEKVYRDMEKVENQLK